MAIAGRSPNYPSLTLREAIERVRKVYDAQHHYPATKDVVAQNLGYGGINGKSLGLIGALKRYALLQADGENLRVSDDAISILELPEENPERTAALWRAATATPLFNDLYSTYGDKLPKDSLLRHELIKRKFLPKAADEVIRIYRDNLDLVTPQTSEYNAGDSGGDEMPDERSNMQQSLPQHKNSQQSGLELHPKPAPLFEKSPPLSAKGVYEFRFPLSFQRDVSAVITIYGEKIKRRDLEFLQEKVSDLLKGFEDEPEPETPKQEQAAAPPAQAEGIGEAQPGDKSPRFPGYGAVNGADDKLPTDYKQS